MTSRRRAAFDPSRLDDVDEMLDPPTGGAAPAPRAPVATVTPAATSVGEPPTSSSTQAAPSREPRPARLPAVETPRRPRGAGGRPARPTAIQRPQAAGATVAVPVRVPPTLYSDVNQDLLAGPERPSYGQLVIWACEDHPESVVEAVRKSRPALNSRRPRGHRMAAPDVQITLRVRASERALLDELAARVQPEDGKAVTRTEVAIAALKQALQYSE